MIPNEQFTPSVGKLFLPPDVPGAREFFAHKSRAMTDKLMTVSDAVTRFIHDGDYLASGGFGSVRLSTAILHEIVRQHKTHLGFSGHTATHDFQILAAGRCFDRCDAAYIVGLEVRGLSPNSRRYMESGQVEVTEWSNATLGWRYKAAAMGVPFLPASTLMGTDTFKYSGAKEIVCPFTGQKLIAVPALFPDVGILHVHRADIYGNAQVDGIGIADWDVARASKRLIITTERIVSTNEIRKDPSKTMVPYWLTDAVCEVPYGSYPGNMPYEYFSDEEHLAEWIEAEKDQATLDAFLNKYIFGTKNFSEYLELIGGDTRMAELRALEPLKRGED
ncbi:glutaconate CoA-transferase, subunit A [Anaerolineae bacterium]|nr:glutaconate CoA-transferase, subunit A [Anaerolineae bacterium]